MKICTNKFQFSEVCVACNFLYLIATECKTDLIEAVTGAQKIDLILNKKIVDIIVCAMIGSGFFSYYGGVMPLETAGEY